jgi:hypothetical protein
MLGTKEHGDFQSSSARLKVQQSANWSQVKRILQNLLNHLWKLAHIFTKRDALD